MIVYKAGVDCCDNVKETDFNRHLTFWEIVTVTEDLQRVECTDLWTDRHTNETKKEN